MEQEVGTRRLSKSITVKKFYKKCCMQQLSQDVFLFGGHLDEGRHCVDGTNELNEKHLVLPKSPLAVANACRHLYGLVTI